MNKDEFFGDVISIYTRAQAIDDGQLIDVNETAREAGFTLQVETANDGKFTGFLNNVPGCFKDLEYGDTIAFEGKNIIDVNISRVDTDTSEPYFKGCLVPYSVLEAGEKPRFISWDPPEEESDSGWYVLAGDGPDDPMNIPDNLAYVPLGEVVYYDNSFKHLLFLDKETSYYWDEEEQIWIELVGD